MPPRPRPGSPVRRGHHPSASTGSLIDPHYSHPYLPSREYNYATNTTSPRTSSDSLPFFTQPQHHPGPPPAHMASHPHPAYHQPPHMPQPPTHMPQPPTHMPQPPPHMPPPPPHMGPPRSMRGFPHGIDPRMMDPAEREWDMRERGEMLRDGGREPPPPRESPAVNQPAVHGLARRNTVNGQPRPILRHPSGPTPHAPPPPREYGPPSPGYRPQIVHGHPPEGFPRDHSPDDYDEYHAPGQYMVTPGLGPHQPQRGRPSPDGPHYSYAPPEHANHYIRGRPPPHDMPPHDMPPHDMPPHDMPPYDRGMPPPPVNGPYNAHRPGMSRTRSPSRHRRRSRSLGRSDSRPAMRESMARRSGDDWDDYDDHRDESYSGSGGRTSSRNGSDEMSGGSGPHSRALTRTRSISQSGGGGFVARRPDIASAGGPPGAPGGGKGIRVDLGGTGALDIMYSGTGDGRPPTIGHIIINQRSRENQPRNGEPTVSGNSNAFVPASGAGGILGPAFGSMPVPPPSNQTTALSQSSQPQPPPPPPGASSGSSAPQVAVASTPNIVGAGVPGELPAGIILDADAEREKMVMEQQLSQGVNALTLSGYNYPPDSDHRIGGLRKRDDDFHQSSALVPRDRDRDYERDDDRSADRDRYWDTAANRRDRGRSREDRWRDSERYDWEGEREREREREKPRRRPSSQPPRRRSASAGPKRRDGPRYTKISREIVSPKAVEEKGWEFDATPEAVTVYRVLTRDEIDELVDLTARIRKRGRRERERERDQRRGHAHSHSHSHPRRERGDRVGGPPMAPPPPPPPPPIHPQGAPGPPLGHHLAQGHHLGRPPAPGPPLGYPLAPGPPLGYAPASSPKPRPENALAQAPAPAPPPPPPPEASLVPPGPAPPPAPSPAPTPGPQAQAAAPPPLAPPAPPLSGPMRPGGLMENPAEPGTYLKYRRNPPPPRAFYTSNSGRR